MWSDHYWIWNNVQGIFQSDLCLEAIAKFQNCDIDATRIDKFFFYPEIAFFMFLLSWSKGFLGFLDSWRIGRNRTRSIQFLYVKVHKVIDRLMTQKPEVNF